MDKKLKHEIKKKIENSIRRYFKKKRPKKKHVLDLIFPTERKIRSLIGGLETSLGTQLWEPLAKLIAEKNEFEILNINDVLTPKKMPKEVEKIITKWRRKRNRQGSKQKLNGFISELKTHISQNDYSNLEFQKMSKGEGIDIYLKKGEKEYAFDIKSNQINAKQGKSFNDTLMLWYASRLLMDVNVDFYAAIACPFNPYEEDWDVANGGRAHPLKKGIDLLVEDEFWNLLSGEENTWNNIKEQFDKLRQEDFGSKFKDDFKSQSSS